MTSEPQALIDRRVTVISGPKDLQSGARRVSDLRDTPFVVFLGEPGIGKSSVMASEAAHEAAPLYKVRDLMNGDTPDARRTLFLDALDEFRIDGWPADKANDLARAMKSVGAARWRLSCRAEDWRKDADIVPIQRLAADEEVVVVQLLPLDETEALAVLAAIGESDGPGFLAKAQSLGAGALAESPLSLKLLHKAVTQGGDWPETRFALYAAAIRRMALEHNVEHKYSERAPTANLIAEAGKACLLLLTTGRRAIWRAHDDPPLVEGGRAFLTLDDLGLERQDLKDIVGSALFRGEGEAFEPAHRTIAEFLAGQALARAVVGDGDHAALPLSRAIALITGHDGLPPSELRGLYAWFAAHLADLGAQEAAARLIAADSFTVLAYGDAAAFKLDQRRAILASLGQDDPYFRMSDTGATTLGGLIHEDLLPELTAVLDDVDDDSHRMLTVLEALALAGPLAALRPKLRAIALDPERPTWQRRRAIDAWLNGDPNPAQARRSLLEALASEPLSVGREDLRIDLLSNLPVGAVTDEDLKGLLSDFEVCADDNTLMRLFALSEVGADAGRAQFFDTPASAWRRPEDDRTRASEISGFLDQMLAARIKANPALDAATLWRWQVNARQYAWDNAGPETAQATRVWLTAEPARDVDLFRALMEDSRLDEPPRSIPNLYAYASGEGTSPAILEDLLTRGAATPDPDLRSLEAAVAIVSQAGADPERYWATFDLVTATPGAEGLLETLTTCPVDAWRITRAEQTKVARDRDHQARHEMIETFAPQLDTLRTGGQVSFLNWTANHYFRVGGPWRHRKDVGLSRVAAVTNEAITQAVAVGFEHLVTAGPGIDAAELGKAHGEGEYYYAELAAIAGLDLIFERGETPDLAATDIVVALFGLTSGFKVQDPDRRRRLDAWTRQRLDLDPAAGAAALSAFWAAGLDAGADRLSGLGALTEENASAAAALQALDRLLAERPQMHPNALRGALAAAGKLLSPERLTALAAAALTEPLVTDNQRDLWSYTAFSLDPVGQRARFLADHNSARVATLLETGLGDDLAPEEGEGRALRHELVIQVLGPSAPTDDRPRPGRVTRAATSGDMVRAAIRALGCDGHGEAGRVLRHLHADPTLEPWRTQIAHAMAAQARLRRDQAFRHPSPTAVTAALAGGPPVNAADLREVVAEALQGLSDELKTDDISSWKRYWNVDSQGKVTTPLVENACRDHLLGRLRDRLKPYRVTAALPETRRADETRADVVLLSGAGRNLPIEAKRHFHEAIWDAASTQLQGYAAAPEADGYGIYLVFWFGNAAAPTPSRADGAPGPQTAKAMAKMLADDLPSALRARTSVVVLDVSDPLAAADAKPRAKRIPKTRVVADGPEASAAKPKTKPQPKPKPKPKTKLEPGAV